MRRLGSRAGFTLLELLMVVIIIAILASIALPQYLRVAERSRASEALSVLAAVRSSQLRAKAFDPAQNYSGNLGTLDVDVPGFNGVPAGLFTFSTNAAVGTATRNAGTYNGKTVQINYTTGNTCSNDPVYGLPAAC